MENSNNDGKLQSQDINSQQTNSKAQWNSTQPQNPPNESHAIQSQFSLFQNSNQDHDSQSFAFQQSHTSKQIDASYSEKQVIDLDESLEQPTISSQPSPPGSQPEFSMLLQFKNLRQSQNLQYIPVNPCLYPKLIENMSRFSKSVMQLNEFCRAHFSFNAKTGKLDFVKQGVTREDCYRYLTAILRSIRIYHDTTLHCGFFQFPEKFAEIFKNIQYFAQGLFQKKGNIQDLIEKQAEKEGVIFPQSLKDNANKAASLVEEADVFARICQEMHVYLAKNPKAFSSENANRYCSVNVILFAILGTLADKEAIEGERDPVIITAQQRVLEAAFWTILDVESSVKEEEYLNTFQKQWEIYREDLSVIH